MISLDTNGLNIQNLIINSLSEVFKMKVSEILDTLQILEQQLYTACKEGKIPTSGIHSYSIISETINVLHDELDPLKEKESD